MRLNWLLVKYETCGTLSINVSLTYLVFQSGHRTTVGAHVTMKSGGKGLMNVCYDRYDNNNKNKINKQTKTITTTTIKKVVKKINKK